jgi:hypothetical protein
MELDGTAYSAELDGAGSQCGGVAEGLGWTVRRGADGRLPILLAMVTAPFIFSLLQLSLLLILRPWCIFGRFATSTVSP